MRITKRLLVSGRQVALDGDWVCLGLNRIGLAAFELLEDIRPIGRALVEFYVGVAGQPEYLVLKGRAARAAPLANGRVRLEVRELTAALDRPLPMMMLQPSAREVIARIERATGLGFLLPGGADYLERHVNRFQSRGTAGEALDRIAQAWSFPGIVWYQLPDGQVYWGHWAAGPYTKAALPLESKLILARDDASRTLVLPYIPALRPGMVVQADWRFRLDLLTFTGQTLEVAWTPV